MLLVCAGIWVIIALVLAGMSFEDKMPGLGFGLCILGGLALIIFAILSAIIIRTGNPIIDISQGKYKLAFVYQAGDNVSLGLEVLVDKEEHLHFYQFKKEAFEGAIPTNAKTLVVIKSGDFKKLRLE